MKRIYASCCDRHSTTRWIFQLASALLLAAGLAGCHTLPENFDRPISYAYQDTETSRLGRATRPLEAAHPGQSGFVLLWTGLDAFVARTALAEVAEKSIDVQYYLYHVDQTGRLFTHALIKAADRGVRVRVLVDDMALTRDLTGAALLDNHPNIEVRIFNPFSRDTERLTQYVTGFRWLTRRMHNKSFTVDNQVTIVGGRNIGNEYFQANPDLAFGDLDVLTIGPVVRQVSESFDEYWNSILAYPVKAFMKEPPVAEQIEQARSELEALTHQPEVAEYVQAMTESPLARKLRDNKLQYYWGVAQALSDKPEKINNSRVNSELHLITKLRPHLRNISSELIVISPYFVPGEEGVAWFRQLRNKGVRVRVLTNSLASTDVFLVHAGYANYREALLRMGVELYEFNRILSKEERKARKHFSGSTKASLHAKSFILDQQQVFIGSLNLDPRSVVENTEIGLMFDSPAMAKDITRWFDTEIEELAFRLELQVDDDGYERILWHGKEDGEHKVYLVDPHTGFWRRFINDVMRVLPVESEL